MPLSGSLQRKRTIGIVKDGGKEHSLAVIEIIHDPVLPFAFISAGIHGDEPSGGSALASFLKESAPSYARQFNFIIFPLMNPAGRGRGAGGNALGADLNRNFSAAVPHDEVRAVKQYLETLNKKFVCAIDLHEDPTDTAEPGFEAGDSPRGFYLYEVAPMERKKGEKITAHLATLGFPIAEEKTIYGDPCESGVIFRPPVVPENREGSFDQYLLRFAPHTLVFETPTCWEFEKRVAAHKKALAFALGTVA